MKRKIIGLAAAAAAVLGSLAFAIAPASAGSACGAPHVVAKAHFLSLIDVAARHRETASRVLAVNLFCGGGTFVPSMRHYLNVNADLWAAMAKGTLYWWRR